MIYKSDETNLNDFLFCAEKFGERPSKVVLAFNFKAKEFIDLIKNSKCVNVLTEVVPADDANIINEKYLIEINKDMYLSYTHIDKSVESGYVSSVILYYKISSKTPIDELMEKLDSIILSKDKDVYKINIVLNTAEGLVLEDMDLMDADYENIDYYFNDSTIKQTNKLIKKIDKQNKGLSIIYGYRGAGKTVLLNHIASTCSKICIFIPINMIDSTINNPEFLNTLRTYNPLLIIDDCEILFDNIYTKSNVTYSNILQIVDGFYSDDINTHIILSFNTNEEDDIDDSILEANNLIKIIKVEALSIKKANDLCKFLGKKHKLEEDTLLIDVLNQNFKGDNIHVGYN